MAVSPFESQVFRGLFHDAEAGQLFADSAELRAMLIVEGALAKVQGGLGLIPETSAQAIHRASLEIQLDPGGLAAETGQSAVMVPALVKAFRAAMQAPEHAQYVHWGATSQDIIDTALVLRLRQVVTLLDKRLATTAAALGRLAANHAETPMAARTWAQTATPTSFGAVCAAWGRPLLTHRARLAELRPRLLRVSLAGASGTLSAMGDKGPGVADGLAEALGLDRADGAWHGTRDGIAEFANWCALVAGSLAKMGEDLVLLTQSDTGEVRLGAGGGSSTMPQKQNPVQPSLLAALGRFAAAQQAAISGAMAHRQQRDGVAWMVEWLTLPQLVMATARGLAVAGELAETIAPDPARMAANLDGDGLGLIHAEALSFALARHMPRPDAQAAVKALCQQALAAGTPLADLARARWPEADLAGVFDPAAQLGQAPAEARAFAQAARDPG